MLKITSTQFRPNINVQWATPSKITGITGNPKVDLKLRYPDYYLEESTAVVSDDGLTRVKTFKFKDGFIWNLTDEEKVIQDKVEKYMQENEITVTYTEEEI
jgi:hypothetical protein